MSETFPFHWGDERQMAYPLITEIMLSPDGTRVVYAVREPLMTDEKSTFLTHLYLVAAEGGGPIQLTFGDHCNSSPRWSPDGRYIAFLSTRAGDKTNVYVLRTDGGEAWPVTRYEKTDVAALKWSPDGTRIAFLMAEPPSEEKEKATKAGNDAQLWDQDFDFVHLYTVPFAVGPRTAAEATQVTRGRYAVTGFDWFPDGQTLAITHQPTPVADSWTETRLATVPADGSADEPHDITLIAAWGEVRVSPDGQWIASVTGAQPAHWGYDSRVVLYPAAGGEPHPLANTPDSQAAMIEWAPDSSAVYVGEAAGVTTRTLALPVSGEPPQTLADTVLLKTNVSISTNGRIAFVGEDFDQPNAIYVVDPATGESREVARPPLPADWPTTPLPKAEVIRWQSTDGLEIEGILVYPQGYQPGQRYPLVVVVHGGPAGVFQRDYLARPGGYSNDVAFAERGYAVLQPNPRGSGGYGKDFRFANYKDWGGGDYRDIMTGVDHLIDKGIADPDKLGIMGWSYGGFMTSWTITQTQRFKVACVGAAVTNLMSFNGTADIPSFIPDYMDAEFWDDLEIYRNHSAMFQVKNVTTPSLIQHGDADIRVPLSQGREFYNALKRQGVPVEMVIYPRQGHLIDEPRLVTDLRRRAVAWFERWIPVSDE